MWLAMAEGQAEHESARELMKDDVKVFEALARNLKTVAREVASRGGDFFFEWPTGCSLLGHKLITSLMEELAVNKVEFHSCAAGLRSSKTGHPIKKPWTVASTSPAVVKELSRFHCPSKPQHIALGELQEEDRALH
jgi:hypothetical protein